MRLADVSRVNTKIPEGRSSPQQLLLKFGVTGESSCLCSFAHTARREEEAPVTATPTPLHLTKAKRPLSFFNCLQQMSILTLKVIPRLRAGAVRTEEKQDRMPEERLPGLGVCCGALKVSITPPGDVLACLHFSRSKARDPSACPAWVSDGSGVTLEASC